MNNTSLDIKKDNLTDYSKIEEYFTEMEKIDQHINNIISLV